jgi:hypothetical protein
MRIASTRRLLFGPAIAGLFALALLVFGAGRADAQQFAPPGISFPSLTLNYSDNDGPGTASLVNQGSDPATGGVRIGVSISQNGVAIQGHGFVHQTGNVEFVGAFWLSDSAGNFYVFTGTFVRGFAGWSGTGSYERLGAGAGGQWTMNTAPCIVCA